MPAKEVRPIATTMMTGDMRTRHRRSVGPLEENNNNLKFEMPL